MMKKIISGILAFAVTFTLLPAFASIPVFDGANLGQNILTAIRTLQSNLNEAKMLANQIKQLENDFKNLTTLDFSIVDDYSDQLHDLFSEMGAVHGLMQDLTTLQGRFDELYPELNNNGSAVTGERMSEVINAALDESRQMMLGASRTGAMVLENLPRTQEQLDRLLVESDNAVGNLSALQINNQISATVSSNIMNLNAIMSNYAQAHMSYLQRINTERAATENRMDHVLRGIDGASSAPKVPRSPF